MTQWTAAQTDRARRLFLGAGICWLVLMFTAGALAMLAIWSGWRWLLLGAGVLVMSFAFLWWAHLIRELIQSNGASPIPPECPHKYVVTCPDRTCRETRRMDPS